MQAKSTTAMMRRRNPFTHSIPPVGNDRPCAQSKNRKGSLVLYITSRYFSTIIYQLIFVCKYQILLQQGGNEKPRFPLQENRGGKTASSPDAACLLHTVSFR